MNLFVSLVLDTFLIKWEAVYGSQDDDEGGTNADVAEGWDVTSSSEHLVSHQLFNLCVYMYIIIIYIYIFIYFI